MKELKQKSTPMLRQTGMTLIELMITIFIMAILATTAVPAMKGFFGNKTIESVAKIFEQSLRAGRSEAADREVQVRIRPLSSTASWNEGWQLEYTDTGGATVIIRRVEALSNNLALSSTVYSDSNPLTFDPSGYPLQIGSFVMSYTDCSNSNKLFTYTILASGLTKRVQSTNTGC